MGYEAVKRVGLGYASHPADWMDRLGDAPASMGGAALEALGACSDVVGILQRKHVWAYTYLDIHST